MRSRHAFKCPGGPVGGLIPWGRVSLVLAAAAGAILLCACEPKKEVHQARPPVPVAVAEVKAQDSPLSLAAIGEVKAYNTLTVRSRVTGQLLKIHFRQGDYVKEKDLLFTIDPIPFKLALDQAQADLSRDKAQAEQAVRTADRFEKLVKTGSVSYEVAEEKVTAAATARETVLADQAKVAIAKQNLDYCYIHAPFTGRSGNKLIDEGNLVRANDDALIAINQIEPIRVRFSLPERYLSQVKTYRDQGTLEVQAFVLGREDKPETGNLTFVGAQVNRQTGMIDLEGTFQNQERFLWPGLYVTVNLILTVEKQIIQAPYRAIKAGPESDIVFVVKPDLTAEIRPVEKGRRIGDNAAVLKGLKPGEKVVTDGQLNLYPGAKVIIKPSPAGPSQPNQTAPSQGRG